MSTNNNNIEKNQLKISKLIVRRILSIETADEKKLLDDWLDKSPKNRKLYDRLTNSAFFTEKNEECEKFDVESDYTKMINKGRRRSSIRLYSRIAACAAAVVLVASISVLFFEKNDSIIVPNPSTKAVLVLSGGEKINIGDTLLEQVDNGTIIQINKAGVDYMEGVENSQNSTDSSNTTKNTLIIPKAQVFSIVLSDGTKVWLNSETTLTYPVVFGDKERNVELIGEAYFEVKHMPEKPFNVLVNGAKIQVLGTRFNLNAYDNETSILTTLIDGSVKMLSSKTNMLMLLQPGQQGVIDHNGDVSAQFVDTELYTAWMQGRLVFRNMPIVELLRVLERIYDFQVDIDDAKVMDVRYTGDMDKSLGLINILKIIESSGRLKFDIKGSNITVKIAEI